MIIQAIALLDDLDKEINIYSMRVKVRFSRRLWFIRPNSDSLPPFLSFSRRSGTDGTSPRWPRSSSTILLTPRSSEPWVRLILSQIFLERRPF